MNNDEAWYFACKEIIDRCVAPDMYGNALALLDKALSYAIAQPIPLELDIHSCSHKCMRPQCVQERFMRR